MPNIEGVESVPNEEHFLQHGDLVEERIQKRGDMYEYEIKTLFGSHEWNRDKRTISKEEFHVLKAKAPKSLLRDSYLLSQQKPRVSIKQYHGDYRELIFAQVEFDSHDEAESYEPLPWMGTEITNSHLGRDSQLLLLDREHFLEILRAEESKSAVADTQ